MSRQSVNEKLDNKILEQNSDLPDQATEYVLSEEVSAQQVIVLGRTKKRLEVALIDASTYRPNWFIVAYLNPKVDGKEQTSPEIDQYVRAMPFINRHEAAEFAKAVVLRWHEDPPEITSYGDINLTWQVNPNMLIRLANMAEEVVR